MAIHPTKTFLTPEKASLVLARAIGAGDLEAASNCFARDACFVAPDATTIRSRDEIRPIIAQMIAVDTQVEVEDSAVLVAGDVALVSERWHINFRDVHGTPFHQTAPASMVLRRLRDDWTLSIAAPWGWGKQGCG